MMTEEEKVTTYRVGIDVMQACGLEHRKGGGATVLSVECFGNTERVPIRGDSFDSFFVFLVIVDRSRTKEYLTIKVLDLPKNETTKTDTSYNRIVPSAMNTSLVGQYQFDIEQVHSSCSKNGSWCLLTRPDSDLCTGWLKCHIRVSLEQENLPNSNIHISSPLPVVLLSYPGGYERAFDLIIHVDIWKAEGFTKQSLNKSIPVSMGIRVGSGKFSHTEPHRSSLNSGWCVRLSICLQLPHPCDLLEMIVWSSKVGGMSNAARRYLPLSEASQFPKWVDFYSVRDSNPCNRDSHAGRMLLSFEVEKISLSPARVEKRQFILPWCEVMLYLPVSDLRKMMIVSKHTHEVLMSVKSLRDFILHPRVTSQPLLPPPPSDSTSYSLRVDLYDACGLECLIKQYNSEIATPMSKPPLVYAELSWGGVRAWTTTLPAATASWNEQLTELSLELPVRYEDMPTLFLKVIQVKTPSCVTIGQLLIEPRRLLQNPISSSIKWYRLSPHEPAFLQASLLLRQTSQLPIPRPPVMKFNKIKYQARVHVWFVRGIVQQRNRPMEVEVQCGKEVASSKAKKGVRVPTWNKTISLSICILEPQAVGSVKNSDWRTRIAECVRGEAQRREAVGLETVGLLNITIKTDNSIKGMTSIPLNHQMVVRDGSMFGDVSASYSPRRPTWVSVGTDCSVLISVDILHPDLSRFHPTSAHPLRATVRQKLVLSAVIANLQLYCAPCGFIEGSPITVILSIGRHQICVEALSCTTFESFLTSPFVAVFPYACPEDSLFDLLFLVEIRSGSGTNDLVLGSFSAPIGELLQTDDKLSSSPKGIPVMFSDVIQNTRRIPPSNWKPPETFPLHTLSHSCRSGVHPGTNQLLDKTSTREAGSFRATWVLRPYSTDSV